MVDDPTVLLGVWEVSEELDGVLRIFPEVF
jgi:hypothetical protein